MRLTVLYDDRCPLCARFRDWLARQPLLVPLDLVPAGSEQARRRYPGLDHDRTLREVTVVSDRGEVWHHDAAWVMCLWATVEHRVAAERLARPAFRPLARAAAHTAAGLRSAMRTGPAEGGGYGDRCAGSCEPSQPLGQG
ncbi:MAG: DUF393 domain-containing protein [Nocardioidaceae bacterium]|nr:DUF393 domain-containing protein [Nocardioidaceae bacterium]NUS52186.1 DUF393 domain-containing protein [Nocardioidaceae bacterium]